MTNTYIIKGLNNWKEHYLGNADMWRVTTPDNLKIVAVWHDSVGHRVDVRYNIE